jgi:hypothetical protein
MFDFLKNSHFGNKIDGYGIRVINERKQGQLLGFYLPLEC